jgi:hypothetical protein
VKALSHIYLILINKLVFLRLIEISCFTKDFGRNVKKQVRVNLIKGEERA